MFKRNAPRYASSAVVAQLPGKIIDSIWYLIDRDLTGVVPLNQLISFKMNKRENGYLSLTFNQEDYELQITFDLPIAFNPLYPTEIIVYDDGLNQTVMLPSEVK